MKRHEIKKILLKFGYTKNTVDKFFQLKLKPTADKMFKLEDEFGIPVSAWRDIKSYLNNPTPTKNNVQGNS